MKTISTFAVIACAVLGTVNAFAAAPAAPANAPMASSGLKDYNIRVNPLGLAFGTLNGTFDFGVSDSITVGPMGEYVSVTSSTSVTIGSNTTTSSSKTTGLGIGAQANFFLSQNRFLDSWVFTPFMEYVSLSSGNASSGALVFGGNFGYQWFWNNGFNTGLGLGAAYYSFDETLFAIHGFIPSGYFTVGYAF